MDITNGHAISPCFGSDSPPSTVQSDSPDRCRTPARSGCRRDWGSTTASYAHIGQARRPCKPTEMPMRGSGSEHAQIGEAGLLGSGRPLGQIFSPPTESGKRHDQQTSVIGLTNLPCGGRSSRGGRRGEREHCEQEREPPPSARSKRPDHSASPIVLRKASIGALLSNQVEAGEAAVAMSRTAAPIGANRPTTCARRKAADDYAQVTHRPCQMNRMRRSAWASGAAMGVRRRSSQSGINPPLPPSSPPARRCASPRPTWLDDGRSMLDAEARGELAFLIEIEATLPARHLLDRGTAYEDDLRVEIGGDLPVAQAIWSTLSPSTKTSACRIATKSSGLIRCPARPIRLPFCRCRLHWRPAAQPQLDADEGLRAGSLAGVRDRGRRRAAAKRADDGPLHRLPRPPTTGKRRLQKVVAAFVRRPAPMVHTTDAYGFADVMSAETPVPQQCSGAQVRRYPTYSMVGLRFGPT